MGLKRTVTQLVSTQDGLVALDSTGECWMLVGDERLFVWKALPPLPQRGDSEIAEAVEETEYSLPSKNEDCWSF